MSGDCDLDAGPDPARFAAGAAEPEINETVDDPVYAIGVGPGNPEYLTPRGERAIREADVVVGFTTVVEFVEEKTDADLLTCGYEDEAAALEEFAERVAAGESGAAVAMGDPNHSGYQFVGKVQDAVERASTNPDSHARQDDIKRGDSDVPVRIVPGISSLQVAASRARTPMEDTEFVTLHKSGNLEADMDRLAAAADDRHLLVLPRPYDRMPADIAAFLLEQGAEPTLEALVLERLSHDDEEIHRFTLAELSEHAGGNGKDGTPFSDLVVLAVRQPV
ncbi:cobalt-precorrin-7 (C(5))-methyltransferase [Natrinema gelatinilyticum]|uniref:cobalt-precorrin-7 (C(5))-methyltransferase n=1 Tax=Natrinema gelatinilyticum TaxID=2961571 RepID=UPI0020C597ED|nr:cobalt-precorrin-7 (C(5))-methyltransferase [Natrinema gelatinilyticum]